MKILRKILLYTLATAIVLVVSLVASLYLFKDRIIQQFIREANKNISTPVKVGRIDASLWNDFPNLAMVLQDVYVEDSHPGEYPLLTAREVSFTLNPLEVWQGRYVIHGLTIRDSETNLLINKAGQNNYTIVKNGQGKGTSSVSFDLKNVNLTKSLVTYKDLGIGHHHEFFSEQLTTEINAKDDQYRIQAKGDLISRQIGMGSSIYFRNKSMNMDALVNYDDLEKILIIESAQLEVEGSPFEIKGQYTFKNTPFIDLQANARQTSIQTLLSLLPQKTEEGLRKYQSEGEVYFDLALKGELSRKKDPAIQVRFGLKDVTLHQPNARAKIEEANLVGTFTSPTLAHMERAMLSLRDVSARLNGDPFTGNFEMRNFDDPSVITDFHGEFSAADLLNFYPIPELQEVSGRIKADVSLNGRIALLKSKATAQQVRTEGTMILHDLDFLYSSRKIHLADLNGTLQFNNNDLAMSNLGGQLENSQFVLNGFFKNVITYLLFEGQPIGIEADLKSDFLDVDQLFSIGFGNSEQGAYRFAISPLVHLNFKYEVKTMRYRRFHPTEVSGDLLVKNQMAVARNIHFNAMNGSIDLSGIVDAQNPKAIDLVSTAKLKGIWLDSLFYVFENFQQDFISHEHLKGQAVADINLEASLDPSLHIFSETLIADVSATIKNGELNNFPPMQNLKKYLDDEGLNKMRFAELKNDIHIEKKSILIPPMEIKSNVTTLQLSGTHTFDQRIDYRVIAPLRNKKKIDPDEAFGAIEDDQLGRSKVYLKIVGTTDKFEVVYDKEAVKKKISSDIKKEIQELKDAFKLKGKKKKKEVELEKDEYFDWEDKN